MLLLFFWLLLFIRILALLHFHSVASFHWCFHVALFLNYHISLSIFFLCSVLILIWKYLIFLYIFWWFWCTQPLRFIYSRSAFWLYLHFFAFLLEFLMVLMRILKTRKLNFEIFFLTFKVNPFNRQLKAVWLVMKQTQQWNKTKPFSMNEAKVAKAWFFYRLASCGITAF